MTNLPYGSPGRRRQQLARRQNPLPVARPQRERWQDRPRAPRQEDLNFLAALMALDEAESQVPAIAKPPPSEDMGFLDALKKSIFLPEDHPIDRAVRKAVEFGYERPTRFSEEHFAKPLIANIIDAPYQARDLAMAVAQMDDQVLKDRKTAEERYEDLNLWAGVKPILESLPFLVAPGAVGAKAALESGAIKAATRGATRGSTILGPRSPVGKVVPEGLARGGIETGRAPSYQALKAEALLRASQSLALPAAVEAAPGAALANLLGAAGRTVPAQQLQQKLARARGKPVPVGGGASDAWKDAVSKQQRLIRNWIAADAKKGTGSAANRKKALNEVDEARAEVLQQEDVLDRIIDNSKRQSVNPEVKQGTRDKHSLWLSQMAADRVKLEDLIPEDSQAKAAREGWEYAERRIADQAEIDAQNNLKAEQEYAARIKNINDAVIGGRQRVEADEAEALELGVSEAELADVPYGGGRPSQEFLDAVERMDQPPPVESESMQSLRAALERTRLASELEAAEDARINRTVEAINQRAREGAAREALESEYPLPDWLRGRVPQSGAAPGTPPGMPPGAASGAPPPGPPRPPGTPGATGAASGATPGAAPGRHWQVGDRVIGGRDYAPPQGEGAPTVSTPGRDIGQTYAPSLRPLPEIASEVVTSDHPLTRLVIARSGMNPSVALNTDVGRLVTAAGRQNIAIEQVVDAGVAAAYDVHASAGWGTMTRALPIDSSGLWRGTSKRWEDVMSRPGDFKLSEKSKLFIDDVHKFIDDVEQMAEDAGLSRLGKTSDENGWFYIPRQVEDLYKLQNLKRSSPHLERVFEEATIGFQRGVKYSNDPRSNLLLHAKARYREVLEKQLLDALEPYVVKTRSMVPDTIMAPYLRAIAEHTAARSEVRRLRVPRATPSRAYSEEERSLANRLDELRENRKGKRLSEEEKELKKRLQDLRKDQKLSPEEIEQRKLRTGKRNQANARLNAAHIEHEKQLGLYKAEIDKIEKRGTGSVRADLFGGDQGDRISVERWHGRFYRTEDTEVLKQNYDQLGVDTKGFTKAFETVGNSIRFLSAVGDFAMPLIQGQPVLATNPGVWARMAGNHYQAFFNPRVQSSLIRKHLQTYQEMALHGVPVGDMEFFAALRPGQGLSFRMLFDRLPNGEEFQLLLRKGGQQTFGRFQASYNAGLGHSRALLWESLSPSWKGSKAELGQYIRNLTGGLDSRALGLSPFRRSLESMWLAFSPRLLRSTMALVGSVATTRGAVQMASIRTLAQYTAGVIGLFVVSGLALGKSWEEIRTSLNPLAGRRFMAHNINGDWIGVGGQLRAISQLMMHMGSALGPGGEPIQDIYSLNRYNNPLIKFWTSRAAVGANLAGGALEAVTGADVLPYEEIDGPIDYAKHIGKSSLPFAAQGRLDGSSPLQVGTGLVGGRGNAHPRDKMSIRAFGMEYAKVEPFQRWMINDQLPEEGNAVLRQLERDRLADLDAIGRTPSSRYSMQNEIRKIQEFYRALRQAATQDHEYAENDTDNPLTQYYAVLDHESVEKTATGRITPRGFEQVDRLRQQLRKGWTREQEEYVYRNINLRPIPKRLHGLLSRDHRADLERSAKARRRYLEDTVSKRQYYSASDDKTTEGKSAWSTITQGVGALAR